MYFNTCINRRRVPTNFLHFAKFGKWFIQYNKRHWTTKHKAWKTLVKYPKWECIYIYVYIYICNTGVLCKRFQSNILTKGENIPVRVRFKSQRASNAGKILLSYKYFFDTVLYQDRFCSLTDVTMGWNQMNSRDARSRFIAVYVMGCNNNLDTQWHLQYGQ